MYALHQFNSPCPGASPKKVEGNVLLTEAHKDGSLDSLLSLCWHGGVGWGGPVYSVILGWYQKRYFLKVFCVAQPSLFQVILGSENWRGCAGRGGSPCAHWHFSLYPLAFLPVPTGISDVLASPASPFKYMRQNKNLRRWPLSRSSKAKTRGDFPAGPVVKILCFHCWGRGSVPGWATKIPHALDTAKRFLKSWGLWPVCPLFTFQSLVSLIYI